MSTTTSVSLKTKLHEPASAFPHSWRDRARMSRRMDRQLHMIERMCLSLAGLSLSVSCRCCLLLNHPRSTMTGCSQAGRRFRFTDCPGVDGVTDRSYNPTSALSLSSGYSTALATRHSISSRTVRRFVVSPPTNVIMVITLGPSFVYIPCMLPSNKNTL